MNASHFAANSSLSLNVNFLANNYYALRSWTILDEKFCLAGILFMAAIILYMLVRAMISASTSEFVSELPDDILIEILVRLPASSVFHFKSVSRSFRSLVVESYTCNRLPPVLVGVYCVNDRARYVSLRKEFCDSSMYYDPTQFLKESSLFYGIKDCKFGLVLCTKYLVSKEIYLCNPATKKCRSITCNVPGCHFVLAFDPSWSKHHYEVIKFSYNHEGSGYIFEVFSSKTGRWDRKFSVTGYHLSLNYPQTCFANGLLYMFESWFSGLIAINCGDGSYKRVTLPCHSERVGALCNSSGTLMYSKVCGGELRVWTLVKNENKSCWLLKHQINLNDKLKKIGFYTHEHHIFDSTLLFHLDTIVLHVNHKTFIYDLETDQMSKAYGSLLAPWSGLLLPWSPCYYAFPGL